MDHNANLQPPTRFRFSTFDVDPRSGEIRKSGIRLPLQEQPFKVLLALLERPGNVVTREEIKNLIWPAASAGDFDHAVNMAINKIRSTLCDSADTPRFVETLPRRGYRFIFPVTVEPPVSNGHNANGQPTNDHATNGPASVPVVAATGSPAKSRFSHRSVVIAALIALALAIGAVSIFTRYHRRTPLLAENDTLVLADFTNSTADPIFDGSLQVGLLAQLEQTPFLNFVPADAARQTMQRMNLARDAKLTGSVAREVCQRRSARAVLEPSILETGNQYQIVLRVVDCQSSATLASAVSQASDKDHVLSALTSASSDLRRRLGESRATLSQFNAPSDDATTSSLEALKDFSMFGSGGGADLLQRALDLDPDFAEANLQMADIYSSLGAYERFRELSQRAYDHRDKATEKERMHIISQYDNAVLGDLDKELEIYAAWKKLYPRDTTPHINSTDAYMAFGDYSAALQNARETDQLDPAHAPSVPFTIAANLVALDRVDEARQTLLTAISHGVDAISLHRQLYVIAFLQNDQAEMDRQLNLVTFGDFPWAYLSPTARLSIASADHADVEAARGHLKSSLDLYRYASEEARTTDLRELSRVWPYTQMLYQAELGLHPRRIAGADPRAPSASREEKLAAALAAARSGDAASAQLLVAQLAPANPTNTLVQRYWLPMLRAAIALAKDSPSQALEQLKFQNYELGSTTSLYPVYIHGLAELRLHHGREAAAEFQKMLDHRNIILASPLANLAQLGLARSLAMNGDTQAARTAYRTFLSTWSTADPNLPVVLQAKAECARLHCSVSN